MKNRSTERVAEWRAKQKAQGRKRKEFLVTDEEAAGIKKLLENLRGVRT
jgi:hypothetical protein